MTRDKAIDSAIEFMLGKSEHQFRFIENNLILTLNNLHPFWELWRAWKGGLLVDFSRKGQEVTED